MLDPTEKINLNDPNHHELRIFREILTMMGWEHSWQVRLVGDFPRPCGKWVLIIKKDEIEKIFQLELGSSIFDLPINTYRKAIAEAIENFYVFPRFT